MSARGKTEAAAAAIGENRQQQWRERWGAIRRPRRQAWLRWPELIGLAASALLLLFAALVYFHYLLPAREQLTTLQTQRAQLQSRTREQEAGIKNNADAEALVTEIRDSLRRFEADRLATPRDTGRTALIQELNDLVAGNNLLLTSSVSFATLEPEKRIGPTAGVRVVTNNRESGRASVYPGVGVTLSVEGSYANVRHFISDVEASKQFLTIQTVALEGNTDRRPSQRVIAEPDPQGEAAAPAPPATVGLRLQMTAFFRRDRTAAEADGRNSPTASSGAGVVPGAANRRP